MSLLNSRGHREPPSAITARLKEVHPALGMVWMAGVQKWALTYAWPLSDPRWAMVQRGELGADAAYDIWGYAKEELSAEEAFGFLVNTLRRNGQTKAEARALLDRAHHFNAVVQQAQDTAILDDAEEYVRAHVETIFAPFGKTITKARFGRSASEMPKAKTKRKAG